MDSLLINDYYLPLCRYKPLSSVKVKKIRILGSKQVWLQLTRLYGGFFSQNIFFLLYRRKNVIHVWNNMRVRK